MKRLLLLFTSIFFMTLVINAQDSVRQQKQAKTQLQKRDRIHQEEHLMFMDGKLYQMQNGVRSRVQRPVPLRKGGTVNPDGSYQLQNQKRMQLRNGECLDMDGNRYQSQRMFNQHRMMTQQQMQQHQIMNQQRNQMKGNRGGNRKG